MSDIPSWLVIGVPIWVILLAFLVRAWLKPQHVDGQGACPECRHKIGLEPTRRHCGDFEPTSGWGSNDQCRCKNDYHWNFESIGLDD